ncbi:uncharacterized protein DS421_7g216360 [Arachis hypogaea]|nr:uncharacterized protein DS421_7g216360 [Arachis hypogaea]
MRKYHRSVAFVTTLQFAFAVLRLPFTVPLVVLLFPSFTSMNPNLFCSEKRSCTLSTKLFLQTSILDYSNFVSTDTTTSKEE